MYEVDHARTFIVPEEQRERLSFAAPWKVQPVTLPSGPRDLPKWSKGGHINWRWYYSNSPDYMVRCAFDPLKFATDGSPVWRRFTYEYGGKKGAGWIAEQDGVASVHYHDGMISLVEFEDNVTDEKGHVVYIEKPDWQAGKPGIPQTRKYSMLATTQQEGYGGRAFTITLAEQEIPIYSRETGTVMTKVQAGTKLRLRGPWHGGAPTGYTETSYWIDEDQGRWGSWINQRKWYERGGYFGLYIKPEILLDILATYEPHVPWAVVTESWRGKDEERLRPLIPETGLPKEWKVHPEQCPGHDYVISPWSTGRDRTRPSDTCRLCGEKRDPAWVYRSSNGTPVINPNAKEPIHFDLFLTTPAPKAPIIPAWPVDVKVPLRSEGFPGQVEGEGRK